jgi:hypothetical protein
MVGWAQSSSEIAHRDRLAASLAAVGVASAAVLAVAGAPPWLAILVAIVGFVTALARLALEVARQRAESRETWSALLRRPPERVAELVASAGFYELGVETEAGEALAALGRSDDRHAPYVARDADAELHTRLLAASAGDRAELIVLSGPAKAGKSRTLAEVAARLPDAWLLAPRTSPRWRVDSRRMRSERPLRSSGSTTSSRSCGQAIRASAPRLSTHSALGPIR